MSSRGASEVQSTSAPSFPVAGAAFPAAAAGLGQGLSLEQMRSYLITLGWQLSQIQDFDDVVLAQVVNIVLSQAESSAKAPLPHTANTTQSGLDIEALLEDEFAGLTDSDMNPSWYLDPLYWEHSPDKKLPEISISAIPFAENYPGRDNHLDLLKARLFVWNVMHGHAVNAHAEGDWAYWLVDVQGQVLDGATLRHEYNNLSPEIKAVLDQSCNVTFPMHLTNPKQKVQVWPDHQSYGAHMGFAVFVLAKLLRTEQVKSFRALWYLARQFRLCAPGFTKRNNNSPVVADAFAISRSGGQKQIKLLPTVDVLGADLTTPLDNQYSEFKDQFKPQGGKPLNVEVLLSSGKLQLTCCEDREVNGLKTPLIVHTPPQSIPAVLGVLEFYYNTLGFGQENANAAIASSSANPKQDLFYLFWWSAHGCLDSAGSAAKSDLCLRALYLALFNKPLPAWMPGFVPDIEAMLCKDTGEFLSKINGNEFEQNAAKAFAGGCN